MNCPQCKAEMENRDFKFKIGNIDYSDYWMCWKCHVKKNYPSCFQLANKKIYFFVPSTNSWIVYKKIMETFIFR